MKNYTNYFANMDISKARISALVVFKYPTDVFWAFSSHIFTTLLIIWWLHLFCCWAEHWDYWKANATSLQCRRPISIKRTQTNKTTRINMLMNGGFSQEHHFWRLERVLIPKLKLQSERLTCIKSSFCTLKGYMPNVFHLVFDL